MWLFQTYSWMSHTETANQRSWLEAQVPGHDNKKLCIYAHVKINQTTDSFFFLNSQQCCLLFIHVWKVVEKQFHCFIIFGFLISKQRICWPPSSQSNAVYTQPLVSQASEVSPRCSRHSDPWVRAAQILLWQQRNLRVFKVKNCSLDGINSCFCTHTQPTVGHP